ncbi:MAG: type II toxin-antitoxin system RelE/ParE family toxin [Gemmataceae bacterium]|nr:type II toxin-antitoxin system RelE/ParE family toxin [Gemmataceae bacterium]
MQPDYSRLALRDIDEIAESIRKDRPRSAVRFLDGVKKTVQRLLDFPESAGRFESGKPELEGLRVVLVRGFKKYLWFYRIHIESIFVERVLHGARNLDDLL